jgi:hypothetical protein
VDRFSGIAAGINATSTGANIPRWGMGVKVSTITDTRTGPGSSAQQFVSMMPPGTTLVMNLNATAVVTKVGAGGIEVLGDTYSVALRRTLKNVGGTISTVPLRAQVPPYDADASMIDASLDVRGAGGNAYVTWANGALLGTGAQVVWTIGVAT